MCWAWFILNISIATLSSTQYLHVVALVFTCAVCLMPGGPVERGGGEEEAGSPPGEHVKPHELLQQNMDGKSLYARGYLLTSDAPPVFHSYSFQTHISCFIRSCWFFYVLWLILHWKCICHSRVHSSVCLLLLLLLLPPQEGLCSLWFGASCFRSSLHCIGGVQAVILIQEGCDRQQLL